HNFFEVTKIDDLYVYQNLNFDGFDYVVEPNNIKVTLKSSIDGTLVMPEIYYPGWVAIVDGNQRPIKKIDNLFLAVDLKPKDREVVFKFRPRLFTIGLAITMFTIISSLLFIIRKNYR
ncbi:MAG TPA: YfhO family protein, partial [Patescibacteria group bacterium]